MTIHAQPPINGSYWPGLVGAGEAQLKDCAHTLALDPYRPIDSVRINEQNRDGNL